MERDPSVRIIMENGKEICMELRPKEAPNTVNSFLYLAGLHIFDGHPVERLVPDFVADVSYTAFHRDEAKYLIPYETRSAGFPNHLGALPGTVVMGGYENGIAGGEFFFPLAENDRITWSYPAFGVVTSGFEEISRWNTLSVRKVDFPPDPSVTITAPAEPLVIRKVLVETFGISYPEPERIRGAVLPPNWG